MNFFEVEDLRFVFTQVCLYLNKLIVYVVFSDFDETWPEYSSDIDAQEGAMFWWNSKYFSCVISRIMTKT